MMTNSSNFREIPLDQIQTDGTTQMRVAGIDPSVAADYADAMTEGAAFPPIVVYHDGAQFWPGDGFHRIEAAKRINRETIAADVREGSQRDALLFAASANAAHGLRRSQADKRRAIETLLRDPEWSRRSNREVGKACRVDHKTVGKVRRELTGEIPTATPKPGHAEYQRDTTDADKSASSGSITERVLANISDEALIAECRRRGLEVGNA